MAAEDRLHTFMMISGEGLVESQQAQGGIEVAGVRVAFEVWEMDDPDLPAAKASNSPAVLFGGMPGNGSKTRAGRKSNLITVEGDGQAPTPSESDWIEGGQNVGKVTTLTLTYVVKVFARGDAQAGYDVEQISIVTPGQDPGIRTLPERER